MAEPYGLPEPAAINYGTLGFPPWVDQLCRQWGLNSSTYPGHQAGDRRDIGSAPNPQGLNRGIDWAGPADKMLAFAKWCVSIAPDRTPGQYGPPGLEMVIYEHAPTGERVWYPSWVNYDSDFSGHRDHVHTRQSASFGADVPGPPPGPTGPPPEPRDTLFADVSEWQVGVNDSYPYRVMSIRANDGTYRDKQWANNHAWCRRACDDGRLEFFIVYFVWRPNWQDAVNTLKSQVGDPHPRMVVMIDVESWEGQIGGDQSAGINAAHDQIAAWLGDPRRVIGYGNVGDLNRLWPAKPPGIRLVVAGYGNNPSYPGKIAHQYTNGEGYGGGLPEGAPPFGKCDMNSADGLTPSAFARELGLDTATPQPPPPPPPPPQEDDMSAEDSRLLRELHDALLGPVQSGSLLRTPGEGAIWSTVQLMRNVDANLHPLFSLLLSWLGDPQERARLERIAASNDPGATLAATILDRITTADGPPLTVQSPHVDPAPVVDTPQAAVSAPPQAAPPPQVVYVPQAAPQPPQPQERTPGQLLGAAFDALMELRLGTQLPPDVQAPLDALMGVLKAYPQQEDKK